MSTIIIRDRHGHCVVCGRFICLVFHENDERVKTERDRREDEDFMAGFLMEEQPKELTYEYEQQ